MKKIKLLKIKINNRKKVNVTLNILLNFEVNY